MTRTPPRALSVWFFVHFVADILFALPLLVAPRLFLGALGWEAVDPVSSRLVAAALFGIGIESLLMRKASLEHFPSILQLKIIWSVGAIVGFVWSLAEGLAGGQPAVWSFLAIFVGFNFLWTYWLVKVRRLLASTEGASTAQ